MINIKKQDQVVINYISNENSNYNSSLSTIELWRIIKHRLWKKIPTLVKYYDTLSNDKVSIQMRNRFDEDAVIIIIEDNIHGVISIDEIIKDHFEKFNILEDIKYKLFRFTYRKYFILVDFGI